MHGMVTNATRPNDTGRDRIRTDTGSERQKQKAGGLGQVWNPDGIGHRIS